MTDRTNPVTSDPPTVKVAFRRRCCAKRQRLATFASIGFERLHAYQEAGRETVPRQSARIDLDQSNGHLPVPGELF
jgi:hypothetical protein